MHPTDTYNILHKSTGKGLQKQADLFIAEIFIKNSMHIKTFYLSVILPYFMVFLVKIQF